MVDLKILTLNLAGVGNGWFEGRRRTLETGMPGLDPDVISLQEVSSRGSPYPYDQVQDLSERLGLPYSCFSPYGNPDEVVSQEWGGVALLSRWPFLRVETLQLPPGRTRPDARVAAIASIANPLGPVHLLATHLSWPIGDHAVREAQMEHALDRIADLGWDRPGVRFVCAGDLNAVETEPAIELLAIRFQDAYRVAHPHDPGLTWSHDNPLVWYDAPDRRVDYIFTDPAAQVVSAAVVLNAPESPVSDHFGVLAHLRWDRERP